MINYLRTDKNNLLAVIAAFFLSIYILISHHSIRYEFVYITHIVFLPLSVILIVSKKKIFIHKPMFFFFLYVTLHAMLLALFGRNYYNGMGILKGLVVMFLSYYISVLFTNNISQKFFTIFYSVICLISMLVMFIQSYLVYILRIGVMPIVPFWEHASKDFNLINLYRPSSFFFEPQHYASFLLPFLLLCIYSRKIFLALLITLSIMLSTSTQGTMMCAVFWMIHIYEVELKSIYKWFLILMIIMLMIVFVNSDLFTFSQEKIQQIDLSDDIRLTRSWGVFYEIPLWHKISGIGMGYVNEYIFITGNANKWLLGKHIAAQNFLSSLGGNFVHFGIIGGLLYIYILYSVFINVRKNKLAVKFLLLIFMSSLSQTIIFNAWFVMYWLIFYTYFFDYFKKSEFIRISTF